MFPPLPLVHEALHELIQAQPQNLLNHSHTVGRLAADLAEVVQCPSEERERIRMGSLLHDIGKQFIPASILEKHGRLSPIEYYRIQQHPWLGYSYLNSFVSDPVILNTVLYHHERWNGTGYPYGLKGDQIPLGARICALSDVWDALVSERCYRSAWSITQAADLIGAGAGSLFDPELAYQFLNMLDVQYSQAHRVDVQVTNPLPVETRNVPVMERIPTVGQRRGMPTP